MLVIRNAIKSITRSIGRNILIGIIVLTIAIASSIALAIRSAADAAKELGYQTQSISASITVDRNKMIEDLQSESASGNPEDLRELMQQYQSLPLDDMQTYAESTYVQDFFYVASTSMHGGTNFEPYSTEDTTSTDSGNQGNGTVDSGRPGMPGGAGGFGQISMGDFSLSGVSSENAMSKFISGESKITDGTMFDPESADLESLISSEVALVNGLEVGSTFTLVNPNQDTETYTLTVSGIYQNTSSETDSGQLRFGTANDPANMIYISYPTLQAIETESEAAAVTQTDEMGRESSTALTLQTSASYIFPDKESYESFDEEIHNKGLAEYYQLTSADLLTYEQSLVPLENLSSFALTLLVIILAVGAVILVVINIFNIRERKYEVGVLTAIGIKKSKVAAQFVVELLLVTLTSIVIGTGIGAVASVPVANQLLESQISSEVSAQNTQEQNFGRPGMNTSLQGGMSGGNLFGFGGSTGVEISYVDQINAGVGTDILLELVGIGVALTIISSLAGVVFVLRYDPLEILANRT